MWQPLVCAERVQPAKPKQHEVNNRVSEETCNQIGWLSGFADNKIERKSTQTLAGLLRKLYLCSEIDIKRSRLGVPGVAEIIPLEPEQAMLLRKNENGKIY